MSNPAGFRIAGLALKLARASKTRIALSVMLIGVAMVVFLIVSELSRASSTGLDNAIEADSGDLGSYAIGFDQTFGLTPEALISSVVSSLKPMAAKPLTYAVASPEVPSECAPYEALGPISFITVYDQDQRPHPLPFGNGLPVETVICIAGQQVDAHSIYAPSDPDMSRWGAGLYISARFAPALALTSTEPITYRFVLTTSERQSQHEAIIERLRESLSDTATRNGTTIDDTTVTINRLDDGDSLRAASDGIKLVYDVIAWGVLTLAGLGLLVTQLIVVRDRLWFFGLVRTLGARPVHLAILVITDVALTVLLGVATALFLGAAAQPVVSEFARAAFDLEADLLNSAVIPRLGLANIFALVLASAWPVVRAIRQDPLDVLEPKA